MPSKSITLAVISILLCIALAGVVIWQVPMLLDMQKRVSVLENDVQSMNAQLDELRRFFFIRDSGFTAPIGQNPYWGVEAWNKNSASVCEIISGNLHLIYNGTLKDTYGNSGVFQGTHKGGATTSQLLLVGNSPQDSFDGEYVILPKDLQSGKFWLKTRFQIMNMSSNFAPSLYPPYGRVNLGVTLMCAFDNDSFNATAKTLWLDTYFAGYFLNQTHTWVVPKDTNYLSNPLDIHAGYYASSVDPQNFGQWIDLNVDFGDYIGKTLNLITQVNISSIRVYGFILFVETIGAYVEAEYDYLETYTT